MGNKTSDLNKIGFRKERPDYSSGYVARYTNSFRVGYGGTRGTPVAIPATACLTFDKLDGNLDPIPEPLLKKEIINGIGGGRNADRVVEMGYETVEQAINVNAQTGIWLYYVLGGIMSCGLTASSKTSTPTTVTTYTTLDGFTSLGTTAYVGQLLQIKEGTYAGWIFTIISHTDTTVTLNTPVPSDFSTSSNAGAYPACEILTGVKQHQIFEPKTSNSLITPITDATVTGQSSTTMAGWSGLTVDDHIGYVVEITSGDYDGYRYVIRDNDATTLTLTESLPADFDTSNSGGAPAAEIVTTQQCENGSDVWLPSLITHVQTSDGTNAKYRDLIGILVKSLKITIEQGARTMFEVTLLVPKSMVGILQTAYPTYALSGDSTRAVLSDNSDAFFTWEHIDRTNSYFKYGSNHIFGSTENWLNECYKIEITIENLDLEIKNVQGDPYPFKKLVGKRDYTILMSYYPNSNEITEDEFNSTAYSLLYALKQMPLADYDGNVSMLLRFGRPNTSTTDFVQMLFTSTYVDDYPDKLITIEDKEVAVDCTLKNAPAEGSVTQGHLFGKICDDRNTCYYGDT